MNQSLQIRDLFRAIRNLPEFALGFLVGITYAILTDVEMFTLALFAVLLGVWQGAFAGACTFLLLLVLLRMIGSWVGVIGSKIHRLSIVMDRHGRQNSD